MSLTSMRILLGSWKEIFDQSHPCDPNTSLTFSLSSSSTRGPWIKALKGSFVAQLSYQRLRLLFRPGIQLMPLLKTLLPFCIACQTLEQGSLSLSLAFNLRLLQYLLLSTFPHKASFSI